MTRDDLPSHHAPTCAVCNKPVDRVVSTRDVSRDALLYRVYCHGDTEEAVLDALTILKSNAICFGQAFTDKSKRQLEST